MSITFNGNISAPKVLIALWNSTGALGMGVLHSHHSPSIEEAKTHLENTKNSVDYFKGKPIKTNFNSHPTYNSFGYDRDAGRGMMQKVADGMAPHIGATVKLTNTEVNKVIDEVNRGITISSVSFGPMSTKEFCTWLDTNRPIGCGPKGVQTYIMLLMYDLDKNKSGYDGSSIPKINMDEIDQVIAYIISKANENAGNKSDPKDDEYSCCN